MSAQGCALLVQPDEGRLNRPDGFSADARVDGGPMRDVVPGEDTPVVTEDVPPGTDVQRPDNVTSCPGGCDDSVACTVDRCNTGTNRCEHMADNAMCDRGQVCDPAMGCIVRPCRNDSECTDGNACNGVEMCMGGRCVGGMALRCDDGQLCNGVETCDPTDGCRGGSAPACSDMNPCTVDRCDPMGNAGAGACVATPIDADMDGFPPTTIDGMACAGGTDCDDRNGDVNPGEAETCNGRDDNCNGMIDEGMGCPPANDTCDRSVRITLTDAPMEVMGTTVGAGSGLTSSCGRDGGADVWYAVTYPATNDLRVEVIPTGGDPGNDPVLVARDSCTGSNLLCNDDMSRSSRGSRLWIRPSPTATGTRTVYFIVDAYQPGAEGPFTFRATASSPLGAPSCGGTLFDVTDGGAVYGYIRAGASGATGSCTPMATVARPEDIYQYNGPAGNVDLAVYPVTSFMPSLYMRAGACSGSGAREAACDNGTPASINPNHPGMGSSYIFVDSGPYMGGRYILTVQPP